MASRRIAAGPLKHFGERDSGDQDVLRRTLQESFAAAANIRAEASHGSCPHCDSERTVRWGAAHGFPRFRCISCRRTFNILTNTPLARLRNKARWLTYVGTLLEKKSIRKSAAACEISATTAFRWHRRFLSCTAAQRARILGAIVTAYSDTPALTGIAEDASSANLAWGKDLLPVLLSWFL